MTGVEDDNLGTRLGCLQNIYNIGQRDRSMLQRMVPTVTRYKVRDILRNVTVTAVIEEDQVIALRGFRGLFQRREDLRAGGQRIGIIREQMDTGRIETAGDELGVDGFDVLDTNVQGGIYGADIVIDADEDSPLIPLTVKLGWGCGRP